MRSILSGFFKGSEAPRPAATTSVNVASSKTRPVPASFDHKASLEDIYYCFRLILGRNPQPEEWPGHSSHAGAPLDEVVATYVNSLEFERRELGKRDPDTLPAQAMIGDRTLYVFRDDEAVGSHALHGAYEPHVAAIFREYLKPGMSVVDIGANIGYFSILGASLVGAQGKVYAFEPNPENAKLLEASRRANGFEHLVIYQVAAGRRPGLLVLNTSYSNGTTATPSQELSSLLGSRTVPCLDLDTLLHRAERIDLMKIDIEGAEYNAVVGAARLIETFKPLIVSEFSPPQISGICGVSGEDYLRFLLDLGYDLGVISNDGSGVQDCVQDVTRVMAAYQDSGVDHIDIIARPKG